MAPTGGTSGLNSIEGVNLDEAGYPGLGKRVWENRGVTANSSRGRGGEVGLSTPSLSSSTPPTFYFPSAAAAATNGGAASRPRLKRRISSDLAASGIEKRGNSPVDAKGVSDPMSSAGGLSGSSTSGGVERFTTKGNGNTPPFNKTDSDALYREFAGIKSARSSSIKEEGLPNVDGVGGSLGDGGGVSRSGNDLEKLVMNVATRGMQQALQYGLRHTFSMIIHKKARMIEQDSSFPLYTVPTL